MGGDLGRDIDVDVDTVKGLMSGQVGGGTKLVASIGGWATPAILNGCLFWSSILAPGPQVCYVFNIKNSSDWVSFLTLYYPG